MAQPQLRTQEIMGFLRRIEDHQDRWAVILHYNPEARELCVHLWYVCDCCELAVFLQLCIGPSMSRQREIA